MDGLTSIENPLKPARTFAEALQFLRSWRQQILTVVIDLKGYPEPLRLLSSLRTLVSSLVGSDTAFATEVSQINRNTNVKVRCNDQIFMETLSLPQLQLASRAHDDDDEEKRKQKNASLAIAAFTQKGAGKDKAKPVCRDCMTEDGCKGGGQCAYQHPANAFAAALPSTWLLIAKGPERRPLPERARPSQLPSQKRNQRQRNKLEEEKRLPRRDLNRNSLGRLKPRQLLAFTEDGSLWNAPAGRKSRSEAPALPLGRPNQGFTD